MLADCEVWIASEFKTPSQFNKARTMLHGLFEFALRRQWCDKNVVKLIEKRKVVEKEIKPLSLTEAKKLLKTSQQPKYRDCSASVGLLLLAGIRPREVRRLEWRDIDLSENVITVRSQCSKTGGVRQVEICPALKNWLTRSMNQNAPYFGDGAQEEQKSVPITSIANGKLSEIHQASKVSGYKTCCATPMQAITRNISETYRVCKSIWDTVTNRCCVRVTSI